jgi:hypothetical protein
LRGWWVGGARGRLGVGVEWLRWEAPVCRRGARCAAAVAAGRRCENGCSAKCGGAARVRHGCGAARGEGAPTSTASSRSMPSRSARMRRVACECSADRSPIAPPGRCRRRRRRRCCC